MNTSSNSNNKTVDARLESILNNSNSNSNSGSLIQNCIIREDYPMPDVNSVFSNLSIETTTTLPFQILQPRAINFEKRQWDKEKDWIPSSKQLYKNHGYSIYAAAATHVGGGAQPMSFQTVVNKINNNYWNRIINNILNAKNEKVLTIFVVLKIIKYKFII